MRNQRGSTTLVVMLVVAGAALLLGFLVMLQRIQSRPAPAPDTSSAETQNSDTTDAQDSQSPSSPVQTPSGWITYTNTKYNFSLQTPPSLKSGAVSGNSVL